MLKTGSLLCFCFSLISSYYKLTLLNRANLFEVILGGQEGKKDIENTANKWLPKSKGQLSRCCLHECLRMAWLKTIPTVTLLRAIWIQHSKGILVHTWYLSFFLHEQNFWRIKFTPKKRVNYDKIHRKLPIFRVKSVKIYSGQKKFTREFSWLSWQIWGMTRADFSNRFIAF